MFDLELRNVGPIHFMSKMFVIKTDTKKKPKKKRKKEKRRVFCVLPKIHFFPDFADISFLSEIIISEYSSNIKSTSSVRNKALEIIIVYFREKTELNINFNSNRILKNIFN